jgi:hypothetical protein
MGRITKTMEDLFFLKLGGAFKQTGKPTKVVVEGGRDEISRVHVHRNIRQDTSDVSFAPLSFLSQKWKQTKDKTRIVTCQMDILMWLNATGLPN